MAESMYLSSFGLDGGLLLYAGELSPPKWDCEPCIHQLASVTSL